uniref:Uncharacterized protein n=1 Tax=Hippocampus comes TaxID=109280 RepID=A0A3Q2XPB8_HIPCM
MGGCVHFFCESEFWCVRFLGKCVFFEVSVRVLGCVWKIFLMLPVSEGLSANNINSAKTLNACHAKFPPGTVQKYWATSPQQQFLIQILNLSFTDDTAALEALYVFIQTT